MKYLHILLAIALVGSESYLVGAEARECIVNGGDEDVLINLELHTPEQLDLFEGCTTLNGNIIIQSDYEGDFILNDMTEFHGNISTAEDSPKGLSRFEMPDLEMIENIHLLGLSGDISLPKLEVAGDVEFVQSSDSGAIDLRSLSEANSLSIRGSWTSTDLSSLQTVTVSSQFCGSQTCEIYGDDKVFPYIVVDLPSLEKTDYFEIAGAVKSVSVPKLEVVGYIEPTELVHSQGLWINIEDGYDEKLDFDAPNLHMLNGTLEVYGGVSSLSLGSLGKTDLRVILNTETPLEVYSTIQTAISFYIWGKLNSGTTSSSGNAGSMGEGSLSGSATASETSTQSKETGSNSSGSTDVVTQGNGAHRTFSINFIIGAVPPIIAIIWASLY
ncbi:uncharacterized protein N7484_004739 [Penicillium longicatenatum]|uniref:uncharacterized protein n=1 Tax=Penicillium longicatenatum TaxID=1561947 RepID=UPI0025466E95|nr:uncharacterized protein N7484_004739 [Penicillium longicatenatum]KAJ5651016.1 hypothetical protein N7484_004739 [Penicillium longicatenatum]